jgi:phosphoribosylformimino-5-aminoimidazole carboxamide ribotide isomerase
MAKRMDLLGVSTLIYTDIGTDGMLTGPNFSAQEALLNAVRCNVIASGGVSVREDVVRLAALAVNYPKLNGVIIGKAIYEGRVDLPDLLKLVKA